MLPGRFAAETIVSDVAVRVQSNAESESDLSDAMLQVARALAPLKSPRIDRLVPRSQDAARRNSLSATFGLGAFPLHSDLAHWTTPARFVVLGAASASPSSARTTVLAVPPLSTEAEFNSVAAGIFVISNGSKSFLGSICRKGCPFFRFDAACMKALNPASTNAYQIFDHHLRGRPATTVQWCVGDILILDNWTALHGRTAIAKSNDDRVLLRLRVGGQP